MDEANAIAGDAAVDWDAVRRAYELGDETITSIRRRFGLTRHKLTSRRIAEGWTTRPPVAQPGVLPPRKAVGSEALELRLNRLVTIGTAMLERRIANEGMTEANARMLCELCRAQEMRMRTARAANGKIREKKNKDERADFRDDPRWLAAEFARRNSRMAGAGRGGADGAVQQLASGGPAEIPG